MFSFFRKKPAETMPIVEKMQVVQPDTTGYFDISDDIKGLVSSKNYDKYDKPDIFKNILNSIDTFIIKEKSSEIIPIGKFKQFKPEERKTATSEGTFTDYSYHAIFEHGKVQIDDSYSNVVLPKFYISNNDVEKYNQLKSKLDNGNPSGGKSKTRRNIIKRQKKYSRKNRRKSRRNRLMK